MNLNLQKQALFAGLAATGMVALTIEGKRFIADANSFDKSARTVHHGEFQGVKVDSPATLEIGGNVIAWPDNSEPAAVAFTEAAYGVAAIGYLKLKGGTVKMPV